MKRYIIILASILIATLTAGAENIQQKALYDFNNKNYPAAIDDFKQMEKQSGVSPEFYFNLGNVYYKSGKKGKAILNYERALRLNPRYEKAQANLDFVNAKIIDRQEADENILSVGIRNVQDGLSPSAWTIVAMIAFALFLAGILTYAFASSIALRKTGFFGGIGMLVVCIVANVFASCASNAQECHDYAIVMNDSTQLSTVSREPMKTDEMAFMLHEGAKVKKEDSIRVDGNAKDVWYKILTQDNREAWVKATAIEEI